MVNHGLSTGMLFLLVGMIYERRHTRMIADYGGIAKVMPAFATFFGIAMFSSIGLPGLNGFVGEFLILVGPCMRCGLGEMAKYHFLTGDDLLALPLDQRIEMVDGAQSMVLIGDAAEAIRVRIIYRPPPGSCLK